MVGDRRVTGGIHYAWMVAGTGAVVFVATTGFGRMAYTTVLPAMKEGLGLTYAQTGLVASANFTGYVLLALVGGSLAVRLGTRRTASVALLVMAGSVFLTGLAGSFSSALLLRFVTGMGNGAAVVPVLALTAAWFSPGRRGLAAGIVMSGVGIGIAAGGLAIPVVVERFGPDGWRWVWFLLGGFTLAVAIAAWALLRDDPAELGTTRCGKDESQPGARRPADAASWREVAGSSQVWRLGAVFFLFGLGYIIYMTFVVLHLAGEKGLPARQAGRIFSLLGLASIPSGVLWGWVSDRVGRGRGLALACGVLAAACLVLALARGVGAAYLSAALFGLSLASVPTIMAAALGDAVGPRLAPAALGGVTLLFGMGQAVGPAIAGWLREATGSFTGAFLLAAALLALAASVALAAREPG